MRMLKCDICKGELKYTIDSGCKNNIRYSNKLYIGFTSDESKDEYINLHLCSDCYEKLKTNITNIIYPETAQKKSIFKRIFSK